MPMFPLLRVRLTLILLFGLPAATRADLYCPQPHVNLGEVRGGVQLAHSFRLVNRGNRPVMITELRPGCGCLKPKVRQLFHAPGAESLLLVEGNTLGQAAGPHTWKLDVFHCTEGGEVEQLTLQVSAFVVTEMTIQPASLTLFIQGAASEEVVLTDLRDRPLNLVAVRTSSPHMQAVAASPSRNAQGRQQYRIRVEVAASLPEGRHEESLEIYTDDALYRHLTVPVIVIKRAPSRLSAQPERVRWNPASAQPLPARQVRIRDRDDEKVVVERVTSDHAAVHCRWASGPDNQATVRIEVDRSRLGEAPLETAVQVYVSSPVREVVVVPVAVAKED
jgi:hypothetical protein